MSRKLKLGPLAALIVAATACASVTAVGGAAGGRLPALHPTVSNYAFISGSTTPPTEAQCESVGRRCFTPQAIQAAYNLGPLYSAGDQGQGMTIAIVDSYGSDTIAHDLHVFDSAFGLQSMCGEEAVTCTSGMPTFSQLALRGVPATKAPPSSSHGTGLENKSAWALEVSLDVEHAHAVAPMANILLVTTPTAETLGVQGFPQMMAAEDYVVQHHLAQVISQSFAASEESFGSTQSLLNLRYAFQDAAANGVTVLGGSGDTGTANTMKQPVKNPALIPYPTVNWPASDPLVTAVGGTDLCTDPNATTTRVVDSAVPPPACESNPGVTEPAWPGSGGGFSHVFATPAYQSTLPAGSTPIGSMRGVPDVAFQAYSHTGVLVYVSLPPDGGSGLSCPTTTCSTGWYDVGGTSSGSPQWAGLVAIAAQIHGGGLGQINPALYSIASNSTSYANDFYDVTIGGNQTNPTVPGYSASTGWDPVTGLGTPDAANLVPDLASH
ncbi:MAG TPA: S53 family peptidase [Solirubrobacteraceae bacterium]|nr:S53 family peptidase [Solirubrobacteraceae bacterium]